MILHDVVYSEKFAIIKCKVLINKSGKGERMNPVMGTIPQNGQGEQVTDQSVTLSLRGLPDQSVTPTAPTSDQTKPRKTARKRHYKARQRHCKSCGALFTPERKTARFCTPKCRQADYRKKLPKASKAEPITYP